jgi:hypothetical protein
MSSFLRNVSVCLFVAATVVTGVSAQTLNKLSVDAQVNLLFERSHAFFQKADSLCDVPVVTMRLPPPTLLYRMASI